MAKTFKLPERQEIQIIGHGFRFSPVDLQRHPMSVRIDGYERESGAVRLKNLQTVPAPWLVAVSAGGRP